MKIVTFETMKQYELIVFLSVTSDNTCVMGFFSLRIKILYYQKQKVNEYICANTLHIK